MRVLIVGGSGFIGSFVSQQLIDRGVKVTNFHRGKTTGSQTTSIQEIHGDRTQLDTIREEFERNKPDVVVDMIAMSESDALGLLNAFTGVAHRLVVISSSDVYRNYELLRRTVNETPSPSRFFEDSALRQNLYPYRAQAKDEHDPAYSYEKIMVERAVLNDRRITVTVLRLPAVYGPGDLKHRLFPYLKRMDDGRPAILIERGMINWRWTRGYVENVAAAISWAVGDQTPTNRIYNVGESTALPEEQWIKAIAEVVGWKGQIVPVEPHDLPLRMQSGINWQYNLETDTSLIRAQHSFSEPVSFREGIVRTVAWERANPPSIKPEDFDYEAEDQILTRLGWL